MKTADLANPFFEVPPIFWAGVNVVIGLVSATQIESWPPRFVMPVLFGLLMASLSVLDRRKVIRHFGGGPALWNSIPSKIRMRFIGRLFGMRLLIVLVPGVLATIAIGLYLSQTSPY